MRLAQTLQNAFWRFMGDEPGEHDAKFNRPERPKRYPKDQNKVALYSKRPAVISPQGDTLATIYELRCPVCEQKVKRSESFCRECGNMLVEAEQ